MSLVLLGFLAAAVIGASLSPPPAKVRPPLATWGPSEVREWIASLGPAYEPHSCEFEKKGMNGIALRTINDAVLKALGVDDIALRHRIISEIQLLP